MGLDNKFLASMVRACVCAPEGRVLVAEDLSGIEARVNAWCAGDMDFLALFCKGGDIYVETAAQLFNVPAIRLDRHPDPRLRALAGERIVTEGVTEFMRGLGKIIELACGYGQGWKKFHDTAIDNGVNWEELAPLTSKECVGTWRRVHAPIVKSWKMYERAAKLATQGQTVKAGPVTFFPFPGGVGCRLPSGRCLFYWGLRQSGEGLVYEGSKVANEHIYGGKFCENIVQAIARDILALALAILESSLPHLIPETFIVLHVHDEIVAECPEAYAKQTQTVVRTALRHVPEWATGLPIGSEGWIGQRYHK